VPPRKSLLGSHSTPACTAHPHAGTQHTHASTAHNIQYAHTRTLACIARTRNCPSRSSNWTRMDEIFDLPYKYRDGRHFHDILNFLRDGNFNYPSDGNDFKCVFVCVCVYVCVCVCVSELNPVFYCFFGFASLTD